MPEKKRSRKIYIIMREMYFAIWKRRQRISSSFITMGIKVR